MEHIIYFVSFEHWEYVHLDSDLLQYMNDKKIYILVTGIQM